MHTKKRTALFVFALITPLLLVSGDDFWIEKPFSSWNERESLALLTDSPWSRANPIRGDYGGSATPSVINPAQGRSSGGLRDTQGLGGSNTIPLYVRWHSSLKVRQALARYTQLHGGLTETEIQQFLAQPMQDYNIAISSPAMTIFKDANMETLQPKTFLTSKKDKSKKIPLLRYSSPAERQDNFAVFIFPREMDGKPTVELSDDEMIFTTQVGSTKIRAVFKLARMVVDGKLDL
jgi:hypothetical protein